MHASGDRETELRLTIDHGVTAGDHAARVAHRVDRPGEHALELLERRVLGPRRDLEGEEDLSTHRVDIGHRVRGTDRAGSVGVVDDRWKEVERLDDRDVGRDEIHRRIVRALEPDEQRGRRWLLRQWTQDLRQWAWAQ